MMIKTKRLTLAPITTEYLESTWTYASDVENTRWMMFLPLESQEEALKYLAHFEREWQKPEPAECEFAVLLDGQHIGEVGVDFLQGPGIAELGWVLHRDYQGKGYATEAAKAVMNFALQRFDVERFIAHCDAENAASQAVMRKLGMTLADDTGTRKNRGSDELRREYRFERPVRRFEYDAVLREDPSDGGAWVEFPYNIREIFGKGRAKVHARFDGVPYDGSIVNMGLKNPDGSVCYVIGVTKAIRRAIGKGDGDAVRVVIREAL